MIAVTYPPVPRLRRAGEHAKKTIVCATQLAVFLVMLDIMILFISLAQITADGQSGYWSPFWSAQAKLALNILK
ncbi:MAG: hypothetical protein WC848_04810 [Parcubacteria group bacterium]|jgi:hypothetical protein